MLLVSQQHPFTCLFSEHMFVLEEDCSESRAQRPGDWALTIFRDPCFVDWTERLKRPFILSRP